MAQAKRDGNFITSTLLVGSDGATFNWEGDQATGRAYVDIAGGAGTVTSVSVVSANGFAGTVATATTTPAITLTTSITGILQGNGTALSAVTVSTGLTFTGGTLTSNISTGVAGSQTIYGGTAANEDLTIEGTSHATKTSSYVILQPTGGFVGIGQASPAAMLTVGGTQSGNAGLEIVPGSGIVAQAYNRTSSAYSSLTFDGSAMSFRTSGTSGNLHTFRQLTTTLAGTSVGLNLDFTTSVTNASSSMTGVNLTTVAVTAAASNTLRGIAVTPGAVTNASGTTTYNGIVITMPAITQTAGTLTSVGLNIVGGTVTSGTAYAITTDATAGNVGLGTLSPQTRLSLPSASAISFEASVGVTDISLTHSADLLTLAGGNLALGANSLTMTGSIAATGARVTKGWFTDIESTNMPTVGGTAILTSLTAPQFTTLELGHATDTTLSRSAAGVLAVEGVVIPSISSTNTLTNKRVQPRILSAASYTTDTGTSLNIDNLDIFIVTAQAGALLFNAPGGTLAQGEKLIIRIKDNGTARALTWNAVFRALGTALPSTTVISKTLYLGFIYNSTDTKFDLVSSAQEA